MTKARLRADVRRSRAARRGESPGGSGSLAAEATSAERAGLLASWHLALGALGLDHSSPSVVPALFIPTSSEPDVTGIIAAFPRRLLPVLVSDDGAVMPGPGWAIDEGDAGAGWVRPDTRWPPQPGGPDVGAAGLELADVVLVAALAVDRSGTRLGQGGGWYDRALTWRRAGVPVVAAVFDEDVWEAGAIPRDVHDVPVDAVITPTTSRVF